MSTVPSNLVPTPISQLPTVPNVPTTADQVMVVQNGNTYRATLGSLVNVVTVPSNRYIYTGNGLTGGGLLDTDLTLSMVATGVTAGTYGSAGNVPIFSVNNRGQLTNVSTAAISVAFNDLSGKPTTLAGYGIVDGQPLNNNLTALSGVGTTGLLAQTAFGAVTTRSIVASTGLTITNGTGVSGNPTLSITDTGVTAGEYGSASSIPKFTVNAQGQITTIGSLPISSIPWASVTGTPTTLAGYGITDAVNSSRTVTGTQSLTGGGALTSNVALSLVNDTATPGNSKYYGTDGAGSRGWYTLTSGGTVSSVGLSLPAEFTVTNSPVTASGTLTATWASPVSVTNGGTGLNASAAANGCLLIGNGTGFSLNALTAGSNITITNTAGNIQIAATGGSVTITNDTATAAFEYPVFANATSGIVSSIYTSDTRLKFKPSTGEFQAQELTANNGLVLNATTINTSFTIASGYNAMSVGPITTASGVTITVTPGQRWVVL